MGSRDDPIKACQVLLCLDPPEADAPEDLGNCLGLGGADFEQQQAARTKPAGGLCGDGPVGVEPVRSAVERQCRIKQANFGLQ